jgi:hypothetical protein
MPGRPGGFVNVLGSRYLHLSATSGSGEATRASTGMTAAGARSQSSSGPGVIWVRGGGEQVEEGADPVSFLGGVPEQAVPVHGVDHAPPGAGAGEIPRGLQVGHDGLHGALGQADYRADVPDAASGLRAISTRTCPWPVSSVQAPMLWFGSFMLLCIQLARGLARDKKREVFLAVYIDVRPPADSSW